MRYAMTHHGAAHFGPKGPCGVVEIPADATGPEIIRTLKSAGQLSMLMECAASVRGGLIVVTYPTCAEPERAMYSLTPIST
jgi:hypothetical protein